MGNQLVEFLRARKEQTTDWEAKRDAWLRSVNGLYEVVREMLQDAIASGDVTVRTVDQALSENLVGAYTIPTLEITVGNERVTFLPKGIMVIGASGRVDICGARDTVTLLLKDGTDGWRVILERVPRLKTAPLSPESLRDALDRVMLPLP